MQSRRIVGYLVAVLVGVIISQQIASPVTDAAGVRGPAVIRAQCFELLSPKGEVLGTWESTPDGTFFTLCRPTPSGPGIGVALHLDRDGDASVVLNDKDEKPVVYLSADDKSNSWCVYDSHRNVRAMVTVEHKSNEAVLTMCKPDGSVGWTQGASR